MMAFKERILDTANILDYKKRSEVLWFIAMEMVYKMALCDCDDKKKKD